MVKCDNLICDAASYAIKYKLHKLYQVLQSSGVAVRCIRNRFIVELEDCV